MICYMFSERRTVIEVFKYIGEKFVANLSVMREQFFSILGPISVQKKSVPVPAMVFQFLFVFEKWLKSFEQPVTNIVGITFLCMPDQFSISLVD